MVLVSVCFFLCLAHDVDLSAAFFQLSNSADLLGARLTEGENRAHPDLVCELGKVAGWLEMLVYQKEQEESLAACTPQKQKSTRVRSDDEDSDRDGVFERQEDGSQSSRPSSSGSSSSSADDSFVLPPGELSPEVTPHQTPKKIFSGDEKVSKGLLPPSPLLCAVAVQHTALSDQSPQELSPEQQKHLITVFTTGGWKTREMQKLADAGPIRGQVWGLIHELFAQGWSETELSSLLRFCKSPLSLGSFLDEDMSSRFKFLPSVVVRHAQDALTFICMLFSQTEFGKIFDRIAPLLLTDLEMMDNSSRDGGCQDRAIFFTRFVFEHQRQLREQSYESISVVSKNFVVLNYLLGCCQKRFGKGSFLNYPFPEQTENFRVDSWLRDCISQEKLRFLSEKNMSGPAAQIAAAVSVLNKLWFMSQSQLETLTYAQSFAVEIAKATHKSSFDTMFKFLEANPQVPIDVIWTHIRPNPIKDGVVQATYSGNSFVQESHTPSHSRYVIQLFSFNLTEAEALEVEEHVKTKGNLFEFMGAWAVCTDSGKSTEKAFADLSILFSNGILNRAAALEKAKRSNKLAGVGHIYAASATKSLAQLLASYSTEDDLGKTFVQ